MIFERTILQPKAEKIRLTKLIYILHDSLRIGYL